MRGKTAGTRTQAKLPRHVTARHLWCEASQALTISEEEQRGPMPAGVANGTETEEVPWGCCRCRAKPATSACKNKDMAGTACKAPQILHATRDKGNSAAEVESVITERSLAMQNFLQHSKSQPECLLEICYRCRSPQTAAGTVPGSAQSAHNAWRDAMKRQDR